MNKISNNFHQRAVTIIYFLVIFADIALKLHGCHYGPLAGGGGIFPNYHDDDRRKQNENETKRTLWLFSSPPAYCAKLQICVNLPSLATYDRKPFQCLNLVLITEH